MHYAGIPISVLPPQTSYTSAVTFTSPPGINEGHDTELVADTVSYTYAPVFTGNLDGTSGTSMVTIKIIITEGATPAVVATAGLRTCDVTVHAPSSIVKVNPVFTEALPSHAGGALDDPRGAGGTEGV